MLTRRAVIRLTVASLFVRRAIAQTAHPGELPPTVPSDVQSELAALETEIAQMRCAKRAEILLDRATRTGV